MPGTSNLSGDQSIFFGDNASFDGTHRDGKLADDGEIWMGSTAGNADSPNYVSRPVRVGTLESSDGSISILYSDIGDTRGKIDLTVSASNDAILKLKTQDGNEVPPTLGIVNVNGGTTIAGTSPVTTTGVIGTSTVTTVVQLSQALAASDATKVGLSNFDTADFDVDANGFVSFETTITTNDGNAVKSVNGNWNLWATVNGQGGPTPMYTIGNIGAGNLQTVLQYASATAATDATKVGAAAFDSADFSVDANGFVTLAGGGAGQTITGDSGGALSPTSGNWNILGRSGSKTSGSGSTLTVKSPPYTDQVGSTTVTLNSGSFATAAITLTLPASAGLADGDLFEFVCTSASALVIQAVGTQKIRMGSLISSAAGTATSTAIGDTVCLRFRATDEIFYATSIVGVWLIA